MSVLINCGAVGHQFYGLAAFFVIVGEYVAHIYHFRTCVLFEVAVPLGQIDDEVFGYIVSFVEPLRQSIPYLVPRAAVLLIFRRLNSSEFTMQTVGRILRMPEQHFYTIPLLNKGYVYTDVSSDRIEIVQDGIGYISRLVAKRRDDITLISLDGKASSRLSETRNRLGSDFKQTLRQTFIDHWGLTQT